MQTSSCHKSQLQRTLTSTLHVTVLHHIQHVPNIQVYLVWWMRTITEGASDPEAGGEFAIQPENEAAAPIPEIPAVRVSGFGRQVTDAAKYADHFRQSQAKASSVDLASQPATSKPVMKHQEE